MADDKINETFADEWRKRIPTLTQDDIEYLRLGGSIVDVRPASQRLVNMVNEVCHTANLPVPPNIITGTLRTGAVNASATPKIVSFFGPIEEILNDKELKMVVAHEIGHVKFNRNYHADYLLEVSLLFGFLTKYGTSNLFDSSATLSRRKFLKHSAGISAGVAASVQALKKGLLYGELYADDNILENCFDADTMISGFKKLRAYNNEHYKPEQKRLIEELVEYLNPHELDQERVDRLTRLKEKKGLPPYCK